MCFCVAVCFFTFRGVSGWLVCFWTSHRCAVGSLADFEEVETIRLGDCKMDPSW